ncbi:MAG: response regulator [Acidobacteriaceae bacterium]
MAKRIKVLLVDDHALVRRGFRMMLEDDPDIDVAGEASDGEEAIRLAEKVQPRVIVMDCALPKMDGMEATKKIKAQWPDIAILMLSMHAEETWVRLALESGANGYILKSAVDLDLADAIKRVAAGNTVLDPKVSLTAVLRGERASGLTAREVEILRLIVSGKSNKEIAADLGLSVNTVAVHRANIMESLGIHNTAELVVYAIKNGLVTLS